MKFGICTSVDNSQMIKAAGWDFIEEGVMARLAPMTLDDQWQGLAQVKAGALPVLAANGLVPAQLKISGPDAKIDALQDYMTTVLRRARLCGLKTLVFGSGGARHIPDGFDRATARKQIVQFLSMSAPIAQQNQVTLVIEPLNKNECNVLNSVGEAMEYVREVNHPNIQCLVDSYHFWLEKESLENIKAAGKHMRHVHVADVDGRVAPGESGTADYRPFFAALKSIGYDGLVSVEGKWIDMPNQLVRVLGFLKKQLAEA